MSSEKDLLIQATVFLTNQVATGEMPGSKFCLSAVRMVVACLLRGVNAYSRTAHFPVLNFP